MTSLEFDKYAQQGNEFMNEMAAELGMPEEKRKAGRITSTVLQTLRDRLAPAEAVHLLSQLPAFLKLAYIDNWKIGGAPKHIDTMDQFINELRNKDKMSAEEDFGDNDTARPRVDIVLKKISQHVSEGQMRHIEAQLPQELKELVH